jgi:hypothetical protein
MNRRGDENNGALGRLSNAFYLKNGTRLLVIGLLITNIASMMWYVFYGYQASFHSDSAAKVLIAREIVETGLYFPRDWNYVNGDLFVLFGHTFIIPLLSFLPAGFLVHAVSGLVSAALILSGVWFLTGLFKIEAIKRTVIVAILASGISVFMAENLYGQVSYGSVFYFSCYILYFSWEFLRSSARRKTHFGLGLFLVILLAFWSNPQRAAVSYALPLLATVSYYTLNHAIVGTYSNREVRNGLQLLALILLAIVAGGVFHIITLSDVNNMAGTGQARWLSYEEMTRNAAFSLKGFLAIFGGLPSAGSGVVGMKGVYEAIRITSTIALLALIPYSLRKSLQQKLGGAWFVASFAIVAVLLVLFVQILTTVPDMIDPVASSRYLVPSLLLLFIVVLANSHKFAEMPLLALASFSMVTVFITSSYPAFIGSNLAPGMGRWSMVQQPHPLQDLSGFLQKNGLRYGYASYWNAGVLSVLSDEHVLVRQIVIDRGLPMPMRHLSSNRWYHPSTWQGETFLLLTTQEAEAIKWEQMEHNRAKPLREIQFGPFRIFVFAQNLADYLPAWDRRYASIMRFGATTESMHHIGKIHGDYENSGGALVAEKGEIGALHFGPFIDVEPGSYTVSFDVAVESSTNASARLDIAAAPKQKLLAEAVLTDNNSTRQLTFTLDKLTTLEFRVWSLGNSRVVFRGVSIVRSDPAIQ